MSTMKKVLDIIFGNWARFVTALVVTGITNYSFSLGDVFYTFIYYTLLGFLFGFMFGWMIHDYLISKSKENRNLAILGSLVLLMEIFTFVFGIWLTPSGVSDINKVRSICILTPLVHSLLAVAYSVVTAKTILLTPYKLLPWLEP